MKGEQRMRTILELFRILIIFVFLLGLGWMVMENVYPEQRYAWLSVIGIFILLFVLYRNKWQFTGWYKGENRKKLPKCVTVTLISISALFVLFPFILSLFTDS